MAEHTGNREAANFYSSPHLFSQMTESQGASSSLELHVSEVALHGDSYNSNNLIVAPRR